MLSCSIEGFSWLTFNQGQYWRINYFTQTCRKMFFSLLRCSQKTGLALSFNHTSTEMICDGTGPVFRSVPVKPSRWKEWVSQNEKLNDWRQYCCNYCNHEYHQLVWGQIYKAFFPLLIIFNFLKFVSIYNYSRCRL